MRRRQTIRVPPHAATASIYQVHGEKKRDGPAASPASLYDSVYEIPSCFSFPFLSSGTLQRITAARTAASADVPAKFSHRPVSPRGHRRITKSTGNTSAVDTEISDAGTGFSTASIKLWVAKENHLVRYVKLNSRRAAAAPSKNEPEASCINMDARFPGNR